MLRKPIWIEFCPFAVGGRGLRPLLSGEAKKMGRKRRGAKRKDAESGKQIDR